MEHSGEFTVQVKTYRYKGWLKKKKEKYWTAASALGTSACYGRITIPALPPFETLKEAQDKIREFRSEIKYHY